MSAPAGGGGGSELGTVFINVAPSVQGIGDAFVAAGRQAAKDLTEGLRQGMKDAPTRSGSDASVLDEVIAGRPVGSATRAAAQKAGKEIGTGMSTGVAEGMKAAPTPTGSGVLGDVIAGKPVSSATKSAAENLGKELGGSMTKGLQDAGGGLKGALKDALKEPLDEAKQAAADWAKTVGEELASGNVKGAAQDLGNVIENATRGFSGLGDVIGLDLKSVEGFGKDAAHSIEGVGTDIQGVIDKITGTTTSVKGVAEALKGVGSGDVTSRIGAVSDALGLVDTAAKNAGVDVSGLTGPLQQVAGTAAGIGELSTAFEGLGTALLAIASPEILGVLAAIAAVGGAAAFPFYMAGQHPTGAQPVVPQLPGIPLPPGPAPPTAEPPKGAPSGQQYVTSPGDLGTFAGALPPGWKLEDGQLKPPAGALPLPPPATVAPSLAPLDIGGHAFGGRIGGSGTGDIVPAMLEPGEYIVRKDRAGKFRGLLDVMNFGAGMQTGGVVGAEQYAAAQSGQPYVYGGLDCSGYVSAVWGMMTGQGTGRHFDTTSNFPALGFKPGNMPGQFNIAVNPMPGMSGHMIAQLPNGVIIESGGSDSKIKYGSSTSLNSSQFTEHYYYPVGGQLPGLDVMGAMAPGAAGGAAAGAPPSAGGGGGGAAPGGAGGGAEQFGGALVSGAFQALGFPDVFGKDPTQWGIWKTGMAGLKFGMALLKAMGGAGGGEGGGMGGGIGRGAAGALGFDLSGMPGAMTGARPGAPGGAAGGPGFGGLIVNNDFSHSIGNTDNNVMKGINAGMAGMSGATMPIGGAPAAGLA